MNLCIRSEDTQEARRLVVDAQSPAAQDHLPQAAAFSGWQLAPHEDGPVQDRLSGRWSFPRDLMRGPDRGDVAMDSLGVVEQALGRAARLRCLGVEVGLVSLYGWAGGGGAV